MKHATINGYLVCSPFFEQHNSPTRPRCFGDVLVSGTTRERQVRWPASRGLGRIAPETSHDENRRSDEFFSPYHVRVMWGCCTLKFGWFIWVYGMRNGQILLSFG